MSPTLPILPGQPTHSPLANGSSQSKTQILGQWSKGAPQNSKGPSPLHKRAVSNLSARSQQTEQHPIAPTLPQGPAQVTPVTSQFSKLGIQTPATTKPSVPAMWNPSIAPTPSQFSGYQQPPSMVSSRFSTRSQARGVHNNVCKLSGNTRRDYKLGEIISIPFHTANHNPHVHAQDPNLSWTKQGMVYSKRRMVVVLWVYEDILFCLPLYTFDKKGLSGKRRELRPEYVSVRNDSDQNFQNQGDYPPIVVNTRHPLDVDTTVHITGGLPVLCREDIARCGRITKDSYTRLADIWSKLYKGARKETY